MKLEVNDVVREKGRAGGPEMTVVIIETAVKLTCNWDDQNGNRQIWNGTPDQLDLVQKGSSIDLDSMTRPRE